MMSKNKKHNVVIVSPEIHPIARTGGLGDVVGALPGVLTAQGLTVTVITPLYRCSCHGDLQSLAQAPFVIGGREKEVEFLESAIPGSNLRVIFVHSPADFDRPGIYGENDKDYEDNAIRFGLFCQAAILASHRWCDPDIIHLHDWTTGLIPLYARTGDRWSGILDRVKFVTTIHNLGYQGLFSRDNIPQLGIDPELFTWQGIEFHGKLSFLKASILYSDAITTVSPSYAEEIQQPEFGWGLDGLLQARTDCLSGIINGADYGEWDPAIDQDIKHNFEPAQMAGKNANKLDLRNTLGLKKIRKRTPLVAMISRLATQKGLDLLLATAPELIAQGAQLVILGTGDKDMEDEVRQLAADNPDYCAACIGFNPALSHQILAGADLLAIPSRYEPCGLIQLYGMKYGTIPVARNTGGLGDTITNFTEPDQPGTGFLFKEATATALMAALDRAFAIFHSEKKFKGQRLWNHIRQQCMNQDWSWERSAQDYIELFNRLTKEKEVLISRPEIVIPAPLETKPAPGKKPSSRQLR